MTASDPPRCRRCHEPLVRSYVTEIIHAAEQRHELSPDGSGMASILAATSACSWNCLSVLAAQLAGPDADAVVQMVVERERQITAEGFEPGHDEEHPEGELALAGILYAAFTLDDPPVDLSQTDRTCPTVWPMSEEWWKPKDRLRDLVRAGALIAADADRDVRARRLRRDETPF